MKNCSVRALLLGLTLIGTALKSEAASILLYDHNTNQHNAKTALDNLGFTYTVGNSATFNTLLGSAAWDLVVMDIPSNTPSSFTPLINYVDGGGRAILSYWDLDANAALASAFDVTVASTFSFPSSVYSWDTAHPIWSGAPNPLSFSDYWGDSGDKLSLTGATMVGGFTTTPTANQGAIGIGNDGRTIVNGFLFDELTGANRTKIIENEITYLVSGASVPDSGASVLLLGSALAAVIGLRRFRVRA